jgi:hypothetical protein
VAPGLRAAACGDRCAPGLYWPCGGGARAGALFAKGDAQPGGEDGPCSWERLDQGAIWMALRTRRAGMIQGRHGLPGDPEWVAQGLDEPGLGSANALIVVKGRAAWMAWRRWATTSAARPWWWRQQVASGERRARGAAVRVGQGLKQAQTMGVSGSWNPWSPCGPEGFRGHVRWLGRRTVSWTPRRRCATRWTRAPGGALWRERLERSTMGAAPCEWEVGVSGIVCGPARGPAPAGTCTSDPRQEPGAGVPHAGSCAGGAG